MQSTSPSAVPLPVSPNASQSDFEALIDLLATDEPVGKNLGGTLKMSEVGHLGPAHGLRDEGGRLDFTKIKALFSSNGTNPRDSTGISSKIDKSGVEEMELTQTDPTQIPDSPLRTSGISTLLLSQPPITFVNPLSFESGLPPAAAESTPLATDRPLQNENLDLIDLSSDHPPWASGSNEAEASPSSNPAPSHGLPLLPEKPTISLTASLALARQEVATLRNRVRELEDLIYKSRDQLPPGQDHKFEPRGGTTFLPFKAPSSGNNCHELNVDVRLGHDVGELKAQTHSTLITSVVDQAQNLNSLSPAQTHIALKSLLDDLGLPPSCIPSLLIEGRKVTTMPMSCLDDIHRAVDLVTFLDELVWRRSRMGAVYEHAYSEENIRALRNRFELWERTVRTRR